MLDLSQRAPTSIRSPRNYRTSVEMIEKFCAARIKTMLDASAIKVMKGTIRRERSRRGLQKKARK